MKNIFLLLIVLFLVFSCKKSDNEPVPIPVEPPWSVQAEDPDVSFGDIDITENAVYVLANTASKNNTLVYKSEDEGLSWNVLPYDESLYFKGIHFINDDIGLMSGYRLTARTFDAGHSWDTIGTGLLSFDNFHSFENGKVLGYGTGVYASMDTAKTWEKILPATNAYTCMDFIDQEIGYTAQNSGRFHKTIDGGNSWQMVNDLGNTYLFFEIDFTDENKGIALIGEQNSPHAEPEMKLFFTLNGGILWSEMNVMMDSITLNSTSCCSLRSENEIYLGAVNGIFYSPDFGASWVRQYSEGSFIWVRDIKFGHNIGMATTSWASKILKY